MKDVPKAIEAVWKIESARLITAIARVTHDIGIAEEGAQDALVTALELWPEEGIPEPTVEGAETVHFILRVTDKGSPRLARYKRVTVMITP